MEKRAAAALEKSGAGRDDSRKRPRLDDGDEPHFKGVFPARTVRVGCALF
jgi:pre-mRNA-splicing factor ATP-dependent RNA helicase DHX38/PRP16